MMIRTSSNDKRHSRLVAVSLLSHLHERTLISMDLRVPRMTGCLRHAHVHTSTTPELSTPTKPHLSLPHALRTRRHLLATLPGRTPQTSRGPEGCASDKAAATPCPGQTGPAHRCGEGVWAGACECGPVLKDVESCADRTAAATPCPGQSGSAHRCNEGVWAESMGVWTDSPRSRRLCLWHKT